MQKITAQGLTDVGQQRDHNEDAFVCEENIGFYVVCDGMGGHASGELASRVAVDEVVRLVRDRVHAAGSGEVSEALIRDAIRHANERVFVEGMKDAKTEGMGTTMVALFPRPEEMVLAHVGDSRIYRLNQRGHLDLLTRDHSLLNEKIDAGELATSDEIAGFKHKNVISRALGIHDEVKVDTRRVPRRAGDIFLLCTDGLTDLVDDADIEAVLDGNRGDLVEAVDCLVRMSNARGGKDNITVLVVRVDDEDEYLAETIQTTEEPDAYPMASPPGGLERDEPGLDPDAETSPNIPRVEATTPNIPKVQPAPPASRPRASGSVITPVRVESGVAELAPAPSAPSWAEDEGLPSVVVSDDLND